jgi:transcriptional regulator with XRE-family HTH domain
MAREAYPADTDRGDRLRKLREDYEYADLASAAQGAGVSSSGLRKWEKGGEIERKTIAALARQYGANPRWIMEGKGPMFRVEQDFLERLEQLEATVSEQGRQLAELLGAEQHEDSEAGDAKRASDAARRADRASAKGSPKSPAQPRPKASRPRAG